MEFQIRIPFVESLGFELLRFQGGDAEIALTLREELTNSWGVVHGGVTMTLLDVVMAHAARSPDVEGGEAKPGVVTVEMKTSFMRPGEGALRAVGRLLHRSTTMAFCDGSVYGEDGKLCAHATGTFKYLKALPGKGRSLKALQRSED